MNPNSGFKNVYYTFEREEEDKEESDELPKIKGRGPEAFTASKPVANLIMAWGSEPNN